MKLRLTLFKRKERKVLINWNNATHIMLHATAYGDEYTEIFFTSKTSVEVEESLEEIEGLLYEPMNPVVCAD